MLTWLFRMERNTVMVFAFDSRDHGIGELAKEYHGIDRHLTGILLL